VARGKTHLKRIWVPIAFTLLLIVAYVYFVSESTSGAGTASFAAANYLGLAAVIFGLVATIFIFRSRVHPPQ
jgi:membrane associated rhomboid family serine protease